MSVPTSDTDVREIPEATVLFAGDSGDGMQVAGSQFTRASAYAHNDLATLPDYPAEIRAPAGTTYGVSAFQLHFGAVDVRTPGEKVDLLVLGWGSTKGAIEEAVERAIEEGIRAGSVTLRHVWPLPADLEALLDRYERVLVPEMNDGQLIRVLRDQYRRDFTPLNKIQGRPFRAEEILEEMKTLTGELRPA